MPPAPRLELRDHPLADRAWDPGAGRFLDRDEAFARIAGADIVLLGETHDNPVHHALQAEVLARAVAGGRKPRVVMEPLDDEGRIGPGWDRPAYEALAAQARAAGLEVRGANLSRERSRDLAREGLAALGAETVARLGLEAPWTEARQAAMRRTLVDGHCGRDNPMIDRMVPVQRVRDALLAEALAGSPRGSIGILGRGHARRDLGVPLYLGARSVLSVGFVEVSAEERRPTDYEEAAAARHDLVWFTPRAAREDPCVAFNRSSSGAASR